MSVATPPVAAPPVAAPPVAARHVPVSWVFCCVVSDIVSAFIMEDLDVPEVRVFLVSKFVGPQLDISLM